MNKKQLKTISEQTIKSKICQTVEFSLVSSDSVEKNAVEKSKNDKEYENDAVDNYEKDKLECHDQNVFTRLIVQKITLRIKYDGTYVDMKKRSVIFKTHFFTCYGYEIFCLTCRLLEEMFTNRFLVIFMLLNPLHFLFTYFFIMTLQDKNRFHNL